MRLRLPSCGDSDSRSLAGMPAALSAEHVAANLWLRSADWAESGVKPPADNGLVAIHCGFSDSDDCSLNDAANSCVQVSQSLQYVDRAASSLFRSELLSPVVE